MISRSQVADKNSCTTAQHGIAESGGDGSAIGGKSLIGFSYWGDRFTTEINLSFKFNQITWVSGWADGILITPPSAIPGRWAAKSLKEILHSFIMDFTISWSKIASKEKLHEKASAYMGRCLRKPQFILMRNIWYFSISYPALLTYLTAGKHCVMSIPYSDIVIGVFILLSPVLIVELAIRGHYS